MYQEFEQNCQTRLKTEKIKNFLAKIQQALIEELSMSPEDEIKIISSDVIESLFGKYKLFSQKSPLKEIRRMILTISYLDHSDCEVGAGTPKMIHYA